MNVLKEAIRAVPAVKFALGIAGIVAAIAIAKGFRLDLRIAAFGTVVMLALMTVLVIFARLTRMAAKFFAIPALIFTWFAILLVMATSTLLLTSVFWQKPIDLQDWIMKQRTQGPIASQKPAALTMKPLVIAAQNFQETELLGEMVAQMLEAKGLTVEKNFTQHGSTLEDAIAHGNIDCLIDYLGAPYTLHFHQQAFPLRNQVYDYVREQYAKEGVVVSQPFNFQNSWVLLIRTHDAVQLNLRKISNLREYAPNWKAGFVPYFIEDTGGGEKGLLKSYGLRFKHIQQVDLSVVYRSLSDGTFNVISGNSTDPELLDNYNFTQLEDDLHFFLPYHPILLVKQAAIQKAPELAWVMNRLPMHLELRDIQDLNHQARTRSITKLACDWLETQGDVPVGFCSARYGGTSAQEH